MKAIASYGLGSQDEWNIFSAISDRRLKAYKGDMGGLWAGYLDGHQLDPGAGVTRIAHGYEARPPASGS